MTRSRLLLAALLALLPGALTAATIQGTVTYRGGDLEGQPAQFVTVVLESTLAGFQPKTKLTDENGSFKFSGVEAGTYLLQATEAGYNAPEQLRVTVFPTDLKDLDLYLVPGERQIEAIEVEADKGKLVGIKDTGVKRQIDSETIRRVPLINTRVQDIIKLMPGVATTGGTESDQISVTGGTSDQIKYILNGANFTDALSGGPAGGVSSMAIERFELISGGFQPEYGEAATGIANIITKTGSNEVEFQYALTWRNVEEIGSELDDLGSVQETWNQLLNAEFFPGARNLLFDRLGPPSTLADDNNPSPRTRVQHQVGVGGPIVIDKVFFYTNLDVLTNDFGSPFDGNEFTEDVITYLAKVTWEVSDAQKFWVEFNIEQTDSDGLTNPQAEEIVATEDSAGNWTLAVHDRYAFQSEGFFKDSFFEGNFTWNHQYITQRAAGPDADRQVNILMPPAGIVALIREGPASELDYTVNQYRLSGAITKPLDEHNIKIGGEVGIQTLEGTQERFRVFNDLRLLFVPGFGQPVGDVLGSLGQVTDPGPPQSLDESAQLASVYVQDLWTITDNLTLEPGLRIDWQDFVGKVLIAPRIGFSLDPAGNGRTQIQGSYGHFYQNLFLDALIWDLRPDQTISEIISGEEASAQTVGFDRIGLDDLVEATIRFEDGVKTLGRVFPLQTQVFDIDDRLSAPRNEQWTFRVRRLLPQGLTLDIAYTEAERKNARTTTTNVLDAGVGFNEPPTINALFSTTGREEVKQWTVGLQKAFADRWLLNASYTQQRVLGPQIQVADPLDPLRIQTTFGPLGRERQEIVQISSSVDLPWKLNLATNFRYQSGIPLTPSAFTAFPTNISDDPSNPILATRTQTSQPLGVNSLRLPPERSLDMTLSRVFKFKSDNSLETRFTVFNLTNETNIISAIGTFGDLRDPNPIVDQPLEPGILPLTVDIPRTVQLEFRLSF